MLEISMPDKAAGDVFTEALWDTYLKDNLNNLGQRVTAEPASPVDGQLVSYVADATNGVEWMLRYYAADVSGYPWLFVGGPPVVAVSTTNSSRTNTAYGALASATPTISIPLAGDYDCEFGSGEVNWTSNGGVGYCKAGTSAPGDDLDALVFYNYNATGAYLDNMSLPAFRENRLTGLASGATLQMYWRSTTGAISAAQRKIKITPVRVALP